MSLPNNNGAENVRAIISAAAEVKAEPPRPLMRELPPADPFPVDALGAVLAPAARAINDRVRAPLAICGQSVLAAATLAVQGHANVQLPTRHAKPLSSYFVSVAATGERKSAVDQEALWPVRKRQVDLREASGSKRLEYENAETAWKKAREAAVNKSKGDRALIKEALDALGAAPVAPLEPMLTCAEPTYEGMCKLLELGQPAIGIFAAEGGQFIGGHGMAQDAKLRTAAGMSKLWDGEPLDRVRAVDGFLVLPGRRVAMHLMVQPEVAAIWFGDHLLFDQGLLSRVLLTAPEAASGTRMWKEPSQETDAMIKRYGARLLQILERPLPLAEGTRNELAPRTLPLSIEARRVWIAFHDHIEERLGAGGELEPVRGLANKLPEHAARIAAVPAPISVVPTSAASMFSTNVNIQNERRGGMAAKPANVAKPQGEQSATLATLATLAGRQTGAPSCEPEPGWTDAHEERAAIAEHDGGAPRAWAEALARLDPARPPGDVPVRRWVQFMDDCGRFLDQGWAEKCAALGWHPLDLFGCDRERPWARVDHAGLLWLLNGHKLVALTADTAIIEGTTGGRTTYYRVPIEPGRVVLAWELQT